MGYSVYKLNRKRFAGYGVTAYCDHPDCEKEIDRGMACACGGEPFSENGCDRYFCSEHLYATGFKEDGSMNYICDHRNDCECKIYFVCDNCKEMKDPFKEKPEHHEWISHVLNDNSWENWRKDNPELVKSYKKDLNKYIKTL